MSDLRAIMLMLSLVFAKANCTSPGLVREKEQKREQAQRRPPSGSAEYPADQFFVHFPRQCILLLVIRRAVYIAATKPSYDLNHV